MMDYAKAYGQMHKNPKAFQGYSIKWILDDIAALVKATDAKTLLDYGCGKGFQYSKRRVHEKWGIRPTLYDPGVRKWSKKPEGNFDGVICCDVMEHIEEDDLSEVISDVINYANKFVIFHIACRPSKRKRLPDGRDVHLTVKPPDWWNQQISIIQQRADFEPIIRCIFDTRDMT